MVLKETMDVLKELLDQMETDLHKTGKGNKTAAQRVRANSIRFAKIAKVFRKESLRKEKQDSYSAKS